MGVREDDLFVGTHKATGFRLSEPARGCALRPKVASVRRGDLMERPKDQIIRTGRVAAAERGRRPRLVAAACAVLVAVPLAVVAVAATTAQARPDGSLTRDARTVGTERADGAPGAAPAVNWALSGTASATTAESGKPAANAIDGDAGTDWCTSGYIARGAVRRDRAVLLPLLPRGDLGDARQRRRARHAVPQADHDRGDAVSVDAGQRQQPDRRQHRRLRSGRPASSRRATRRARAASCPS